VPSASVAAVVERQHAIRHAETSDMSCSIMMTVTPRSFLMSSIQNATSSVSSVLRPEAGSSEQQQLGLGAQRARQLHHLAHAIGQAGDALLAVVGKIEEVDDLLHRRPVAQLLLPDARVNSSSAKMLGRLRQWRPISRLSSTVACSNSSMFWKVRAMPRPAMVWGGTLVMSVPLEHEAAAGRLVDAADEIEDGALAGAVGADDGENLALLHIEGHAIHRPDAAERDRDVLRLEQGARLRSVAQCG
jgi:hypothetical protein